MFECGEKRTDVQLQSLRSLPVPCTTESHELCVALLNQTERSIERVEGPARLEIADDNGVRTLIVNGDAIEILEGGILYEERRARVLAQEPRRRRMSRAEQLHCVR